MIFDATSYLIFMLIPLGAVSIWLFTLVHSEKRKWESRK
jgi:hypothetical protein